MSKLNVLLITLAAMAISAVIIITAVTYETKYERASAKSPSLVTDSSGFSESETTAPNAAGYILKEYNGTLALFRENSEKPYRILDADLTTLTDYDKELLQNGIKVDTEKEVNALIEDFTS